jgi:hypothetical protein
MLAVAKRRPGGSKTRPYWKNDKLNGWRTKIVTPLREQSIGGFEEVGGDKPHPASRDELH